MIHKMRVRLTIIFSLLTCLIFLSAISITWYLSASGYKKNAYSLFSSNANNIKEYLISGRVIRDHWLDEQEIAYSSIISIEDAGTALHFKGAYLTGQRRTDLLQLAKAKVNVLKASGDWLDSDIYPLQDSSGQPYLFTKIVIQLTGNSPITLWIIGDYLPVQEHLRQTALFYAIIGMIGCILLFLSNLYMVCLATKPIRESLKSQNEFIAAASHELRSPLTVMKASLDATSAAIGHEDITQLIDSAQKETDRLKKLTDDLLALTTCDANSWHLNMAAVCTDTLLIELYDAYAPLFKKHSHPFQIQLPEKELPSVCADAERIAQLIGILLHNALEYTPDGTAVELAASSVHNHVILSVIDHGPGIPDSEKRNIFCRFYRVDSSRNDKRHFGLGLSIAAQIAHVHSTALEIEDTPGGGATFRFCLK